MAGVMAAAGTEVGGTVEAPYRAGAHTTTALGVAGAGLGTETRAADMADMADTVDTVEEVEAGTVRVAGDISRVAMALRAATADVVGRSRRSRWTRRPCRRSRRTFTWSTRTFLRARRPRLTSTAGSGR